MKGKHRDKKKRTPRTATRATAARRTTGRNRVTTPRRWTQRAAPWQQPRQRRRADDDAQTWSRPRWRHGGGLGLVHRRRPDPGPVKERGRSGRSETKSLAILRSI